MPTRKLRSSLYGKFGPQPPASERQNVTVVFSADEFKTLVDGLKLARNVYTGRDLPDFKHWTPAERAAHAAEYAMLLEGLAPEKSRE